MVVIKKTFFIFLISILTVVTGVRWAFARGPVTAAVFAHTAGLSAADRELTKGLCLIASYKLEASADVLLVSESDMALARDDVKTALLWDGRGGEAARAARQLKADVIAAGRVRATQGDGFSAEFRVFTVQGGKASAPRTVKVSGRTSDTAGFQKKLAAELLAAVRPGASRKAVDGADYTRSATALRAFSRGVDLLDSDRTADALRAFSLAEKNGNGFRDLNYFLGIYYAARKFDYEKAVSRLGKITAENNSDHGAHFWLGFTYYLKGDSAQAIREFETSCRLKPAQPEAYGYLAMLYKDRGDLDKVEAYFTRALDLDPGNAALLYNLAGVQSQMKKTDAALASLRKVLALDCSAFLPIVQTDADFANIRKTPEFAKLVRDSSQKCGNK